MKKVLLSQEIHKDAISFLKEKGFEIFISPSPEDEVVRKYIADINAIIVRTATKLSRDTIFAAKKLKVIARTGTGVDNIDVSAASERNIPVCNTPEANIISVAEHTIAFILALSKYLFKMDAAMRSDNFTIRNSYLPIDLEYKNLGLVGLGKIGRRVAGICSSCFGMKIKFFDPYLGIYTQDNLSFERVDTIYELFTTSDFISIHIPFTKENYHVIGSECLKKMKTSAFLVNTSRGGIVDETALARSLNSDMIAGAALDVFEDEPPKRSNPLLKAKNIILTPHSAALTKESSRRMAIDAAQGVADILEGKTPKWVFNRNKINF
ncbi:MAG: hydroxyacid dehydrogenase [Actinobacteria bacterium]|nr:hydroxyacid dehydrogenase [Actinomycetota bacterium]